MSESQDQRPSNARRHNPNPLEPAQPAQDVVLPPALQIQSMDSEDAVLAIKKANPGFSFARAEQVYQEHYPAQTLQVEQPILPRPVFQEETPPPSVDAELAKLAPAAVEKVAEVASADVNQDQEDVIVLEFSPDEIVAKSMKADPELTLANAQRQYIRRYGSKDLTLCPELVAAMAPKEPVIEHNHVHQEPVKQQETAPVEQPFTPAAPEPTAQRPDHEPKAAPQVKPSAVEREVNFGKETYQPETSELPDTDPTALLTGLRRLVGPMQDPNLIGKDLQRFFSSVKRSPGPNGRLLFDSPEQQRVYELIYGALNMTPPTLHNGTQAFDNALEREDTSWDQRVRLPGFDNPAGLISPRNNMHSGPIAALRRRRKSGIPNSVWLPATGIYVGFRAPTEREFCDFDMRLTLETAIIGMQTYGLMLSSSSGVYIRHQVEFALQYVTECTLDCEGNDMKTVLLDTIDLADYWLVVLGPIQAKFPSGLPWTLICGHDGCHHEESVKLNIARCIRMGTGLYTDLQRSLWSRQRGNNDFLISREEHISFIKEHRADPSSVFEMDGVTVNFGRSSLGGFFDHTEQWMEDINASTTAALSEFGTEREREDHMRLTAETRRLTRYAHLVSSITVAEERQVDGELVQVSETEKDYAKIVQMLEELSSDRVYVAAFESAMSTYNERTRLAVFGYMGQKCKSCGKDHDGEKEGLYRGIVTISPDRVFFELSRVVSEIQKYLLKQYADIG